MIEKEFHHNDIDIKYEEVLNYYNDCKDIDETIAYFDEKYDQQLDQLGEKNEMFDDDALVYYIVKVIEHHEDIHQLNDKQLYPALPETIYRHISGLAPKISPQLN